ncbi:MAG TPA: BTAD domain-containing putative transcriptional regulator [Candidatus Limnocylindrales bacterium]|nr:BTAD domain-containing putative transcriptional regulator [Candidatus Limnocylindrales bacterium]
MEINVKLFGPTVVVAEDRKITPPGRRIRTLLAMLLTEPGGAVSCARLGRELWGDDPPASGPANLRNHISTLREWLRGHCGGLTVATRDGVLRLTCATAVAIACDVGAFERDLALARSGAGHGVQHHLASAVAARRGAPFEDIPLGLGLGSRAAVLEARWLSAVEDYAEVLLDRGHSQQARDLLLRFTAENPTRERAWEHLMLACYRDGDVASALTAFHRARCALRDLLGVEPGIALLQRHLSILRRDVPVPG